MKPLTRDNDYLFAFYAFAFWICAGKDKQFWWGEFVERRAYAMKMPTGYLKFRKS